MKTRLWRKGQPHIQPIGASFSITMLVYDAVPQAKIEELQHKRQVALVDIENTKCALDKSRKICDDFEIEIEKLLNSKSAQEYPFRNPKAAKVVLAQIHEYAGRYYDLLAVCVMPNHVHMLLNFSVQIPLDWDGEATLPLYQNVPSVVRRIKGASARLINKELNREGPLWNIGYYDRFIRNQQHLENERNYILNNAYKAGLVKKWNDYPFLYPRA